MDKHFYDICTMRKIKEPSNETDSPSIRIMALMDSLGMNRFQLSKEAKINNAIIYKCMSGKRKWNLGNLQKIAPVLGVTLADLMKETVMVPQAGGIREGQGPPQSQIIRPAPDQGRRSLRLKEDKETLANLYELEVEDRSMMPSFPPGTFLTAQRDTSDLIKDENFVVYWGEDGQTYIRQLFLHQDHVFLRSLTQGVPDKLLPKKHMALCDKILRAEFPA